jgi:hypothetical protein
VTVLAGDPLGNRVVVDLFQAPTHLDPDVLPKFGVDHRDEMLQKHFVVVGIDLIGERRLSDNHKCLPHITGQLGKASSELRQSVLGHVFQCRPHLPKFRLRAARKVPLDGNSDRLMGLCAGVTPLSGVG